VTGFSLLVQRFNVKRFRG